MAFGAEPDDISDGFAQNDPASNFMDIEDDDEWDPKTPDISHVGQEYTDSIEGILGFLDDRYAFLDLLWCL